MLASTLPRTALRNGVRHASNQAGVPSEITLALIKPAVAAHSVDAQAVLDGLKTIDGIDVVRSHWIRWTTADAAKFYAEHEGRFFYPRLISGMSAGPALALALGGPNVIRRWRALLGPTKAYRAKYEAPSSLRARFGLTDTRNGFHGSDSIPSALHELGLVFPDWDAKAWLESQGQGSSR